jgi:hypothetical protein
MIDRDHTHDDRLDVFEQLYPRVVEVMKNFGRPDFLPGQPKGDYTVHGDFGGHPEAVIYVRNLAMLRPDIVRELQKLIREFPGWQITITVSMWNQDDWPNMGLYIRPNEIIDGLQRQYFPREFQNVEYEGARRGTAYD